MEILFEILKTHFIFINLGIFEAIFDLIKRDSPFDSLEHFHDILWREVAFPMLKSIITSQYPGSRTGTTVHYPGLGISSLL